MKLALASPVPSADNMLIPNHSYETGNEARI
jgi:hypothetical protein